MQLAAATEPRGHQQVQMSIRLPAPSALQPLERLFGFSAATAPERPPSGVTPRLYW